MLETYVAKWVFPVTSPPIQDGAVSVENGVITYVGPHDGAPEGETHDLGNVVLMPGLINTHTHLELTVLHNTMSDLSFPEWIDKMRAMRMSNMMDDTTLLNSARRGINEGLGFGITTYADTAFSGSLVLQAMTETGVRGIVYQEIFGPFPEQRDSAISELKLKVAALQKQLSDHPHKNDLIRIGVSPHAPYTVSNDLYKATAQFARKERLPIAMHIAESDAEQELVCEAFGPFAERLHERGIRPEPRARSPISLLDKLGTLDKNTLLIHCVKVDDADVAAIKRSHCSIAHCPTSNFFLGNGMAPLLKFLEAQIPIGLGTDSMASNVSMSLLKEAELAAVFQNGLTGDPNSVTAQTALELVTIRGAEALGIANKVGSLEIGKEADLAAFPLGDQSPNHHPHPIQEVIFPLSRTTPAPAEFVAVKGRVLHKKQ